MKIQQPKTNQLTQEQIQRLGKRVNQDDLFRLISTIKYTAESCENALHDARISQLKHSMLGVTTTEGGIVAPDGNPANPKAAAAQALMQQHHAGTIGAIQMIFDILSMCGHLGNTVDEAVEGEKEVKADDDGPEPIAIIGPKTKG